MRTWTAGMLVLAGAMALATAAGAAEGSRLGGGVHYWKALDDIDVQDIEEDGLSYLITYQVAGGSLVRLETALEIFPDGFAGQTETTYAPQAFLLLGSTLYAGLGIGINYADGEFADDPFYLIRAGLDLELLPSVYLDINANYQFVEWETIKDLDKEIDSDTVTLGAALRFEI